MSEIQAPQPAQRPRVLSGIQPTGNLHLGNYLGALIRFPPLQERFEALYCVVDLHALTADLDPQRLAGRTREITAAFLASGVDPRRSIVFAQSSVRQHAELAWIFNCIARMGWLERMTQFKDKAGKDAQRASVGLFTYPVLMAADILLYRATHVPVGEDQKQHLELARDIAQKFNNDLGAPDFFPLPEPLIEGPGARIMSLKDGAKKMSKSDPSDLSRINLSDTADDIANKVRKATTDAGLLPESPEGLEGRKEAQNLVGIYAALSETSVAEVLAQWGGKGFGAFKPALTEVLVAKLGPVTEQMRRYAADPAAIDAVLRDGAARAEALAEPVMKEVRQIVGLLDVRSDR